MLQANKRSVYRYPGRFVGTSFFFCFHFLSGSFCVFFIELVPSVQKLAHKNSAFVLGCDVVTSHHHRLSVSVSNTGTVYIIRGQCISTHIFGSRNYFMFIEMQAIRNKFESYRQSRIEDQRVVHINFKTQSRKYCSNQIR